MTKLPKDIETKLSIKASQIDPKFKASLKKQLFEGEPMATTKTGFFTMKRLVPIGASLALIALVGTGAYAYSAHTSKNELLREVELPSDLSGVLSVDEIRNLAGLGLASGVTITGVELEQEDQGLVYKVKYSDGTFKLYNATTGELIGNTSLEVDETVPAGFVAGVTIETARATAQGVFPNKSIRKIELDTENGVVVYSVRFTDDSRVDVSAQDGSVVRTRDEASGVRTGDDSSDDSSSDDSNKDSDDSKDSEDHEEEDIEDDGDRSGSNSGSGSSGSGGSSN